MTGMAGLVAARELSRLVRDNQDWTRLVRLCRFEDVLLGDEHRLYNPADPQDRMVLGIQGAFNEFELSMIVDRMHQCLRQKAERGEQYDRLPSGYICRHPPLCAKHPDPRVRRRRKSATRLRAISQRSPVVLAFGRRNVPNASRYARPRLT